MAIKFNCPHCNKEFNVKDSLAGKRAGCPACRKTLTVPAPTSRPADVEEFAAAALADHAEAAAEPAPPQQQVEFVCSYCDAKVQVNAELAGKQTSCPECRRIVRVPLLEKQGPKDWRKVDARRPVGARPEIGPAPEGTWDARSVGTVSREALEEAEAIPQVKKRLTWQQWTKRAVAAAAVLAVVGLATWTIFGWRAQAQQTRMLALALEDADKTQGSEGAAELHRATGEFHLHARKPDVEKARTEFEKARHHITQPATDAHLGERECLLTDLLVSQLEMGGEKTEADEGKRLVWDKVQKEMRQTWQNLHVPEVRAVAMREVTRRLIARGQGARSQQWASQFPEQTPELLAIIALEILRAAGDPKAVESLAEQANQLFSKSQAGKPAADKLHKAPPPALIALWIALKKPERAAGLVEKPEANAPLDPSVLIGTVQGLALLGNAQEARQLVAKAAPEQRLPAMIVLAETMSDKSESSGLAEVLSEALTLASSDPKPVELPPWLLWRLVRLSSRVDPGDKTLAVARLITDPSLRGRAQLEVLRVRLSRSEGPVEDSQAQIVDKDSPAHAVALEALARHNARVRGAAVQKMVDAWQEKLRPFGYLGVVLGIEDAANAN
ncbi:MAG: hypothetical protein E6K70_07860 [Planctomycetota bacterium]|nr:MAG: hypothetical protein E6K70_07860 [Planctomycetota bacterium]